MLSQYIDYRAIEENKIYDEKSYPSLIKSIIESVRAHFTKIRIFI